MTDKPILVLPEGFRTRIADRLPDAVDVRSFSTLAEALNLAPQAEIGWFDEFAGSIYTKGPLAAVNARWINTFVTGLDAFPIRELRARGVLFTNGHGLNSDAVADFAVLGVLAVAKRLDEIVRAHDRQEWLRDSPGSMELRGSRALILGYGAIGSAIGARLRAFGVEVTGVRRSADADPSIIGTDDWREQLGTFDWIILAAPNISDTQAMIGADELAAMKSQARIVNIARGELIDQRALVAALEAGQIAGAFLDVATPEPLPSDAPLWRAPNTLVTMHKSGQSQTSVFRRGAERFLGNLTRYLAGEPLEHVVDFARGY